MSGARCGAARTGGATAAAPGRAIAPDAEIEEAQRSDPEEPDSAWRD